MVLIGIVAVWTLCMQALHVWKEVQIGRMVPADMLRENIRGQQ